MQLNRRTRAAPSARRAADLVWALRGRRCGAGGYAAARRTTIIIRR